VGAGQKELGELFTMIDTVYVVQYNADSVEGRGPMLIHSIWADLVIAKTFVGAQRGVMGYSPEVVEWTFRDGYDYGSKKSPACWDCNNGWDILVYKITTIVKKNDGSKCPSCNVIQPVGIFGKLTNKFCGQCGTNLFGD
jgi:hypothetical protein